MSQGRSLAMATVILALLCAGVAGWFIGPNYAEAAAARREITQLQAKIAGLESHASAVDALRDQCLLLRRQLQTECKSIPPSADLAGLIRALSQDVDRLNVMDQTFTAGSPSLAFDQPSTVNGQRPAAESRSLNADRPTSLHTMPLTIDMDASFASTFALLRQVEALPRLVRVNSVRISIAMPRSGVSGQRSAAESRNLNSDHSPSLHDGEGGATPMVKSSIGLEAIYAPEGTWEFTFDGERMPRVAVGSDQQSAAESRLLNSNGSASIHAGVAREDR
jgi:Tfp pilus assembly protein PilO